MHSRDRIAFAFGVAIRGMGEYGGPPMKFWRLPLDIYARNVDVTTEHYGSWRLAA